MRQSDSSRNPQSQRKNILEDSQSITKTELVTAQIAQNDPIAMQRCKALFKYLESSITPSVK